MLVKSIDSSAVIPVISHEARHDRPTWNPVCHITYSRDSWVKLLCPPTEYSFDQALLLCPESSNTWVAWIPDFGETILDRSEIYA